MKGLRTPGLACRVREGQRRGEGAEPIGTAEHAPQQMAVHIDPPNFQKQIDLGFQQQMQDSRVYEGLCMVVGWGRLALESGAPDLCDFLRAKPPAGHQNPE